MTEPVLDALADTPVVFLTGARQVGKSTLARRIADGAYAARYLTLDDAATLTAARENPTGFVSGLEESAVLDEVQRAPELFPSIKREVDEDRRPGRFLLTGSANVLLLPRLAEHLVGRMEVLTLWPLSQGEIQGFREGFVDALFAKRLSLPAGAAGVSGRALVERVLRGGYPEALNRQDERRRRAWFGSYVTSVVQRDVRDVSNVEALAELPRLLTLVATRAATLLNFAELSRSSGIPQSTVKRYLGLLQTAFLVHLVPAWSGNLGKRLVRSPKVILSDTGLVAGLLRVSPDRLLADPALFGRLLENFVAMELRKQIGWSSTQPEMYHFRSHEGLEVDFVLEEPGGRIVGVEVKSSATIGARDLQGLRALAQGLGDRFVRGIVLYTGTSAIPIGEVVALPLDSLWQLGSTSPGATSAMGTSPTATGVKRSP